MKNKNGATGPGRERWHTVRGNAAVFDRMRVNVYNLDVLGNRLEVGQRTLNP